jgi:hypothetical protein
MGKSREIYEVLINSLSKKTTWVAIFFALLTIILGAITAERQTSTINPIKEETVFDPICVGEQDFLFDKNSFCGKSSWVEFLGVSANVAEKESNNNHARVLFVKINISEIPKPLGPFTTVSVSKAELVLKTRYEPAINGTLDQIPFYTMSKMCNDTNWSEDTSDDKLPCINTRSLHPDGEYAVFDPLNPEWIQEVRFDLKPHVEKALAEKRDIFTELIQFYPVKISNDNGFDEKTRECVESKSNKNLSYFQLDECLAQYRIGVYGDENLSEGVRPQLVLEYTSKPSVITAPLIAIAAAAIPLFSGIIQLQYKAIEDRKDEIERKRKENDAKMNRICESLEKEVEDTLVGLEVGLNDTKPIKKIVVEFDSDYEPIELTLDKPITRVILFTDAYTGILNSGSFENFDKDHQIEISTLYNEVFEYNKTLELYYRTIESARLVIKPENEIDRFQKNLIMNLEFYLDRLGRLRESIIQRIKNPQNGILAILRCEKQKYR